METAELKKKIIDALHLPLSASTIAKNLEIHKKQIESIMKELESEGEIEYCGGRNWKRINKKQ